MTLPHSVRAVEQLLAMYEATHEESLIDAVPSIHTRWRMCVDRGDQSLAT